MLQRKPARSKMDETIKVHLTARCPLLYLVSWEEERVLDRLLDVASGTYDAIYQWRITQGLEKHGGDNLGEKYQGPYAALEYIASSKDRALFILLDFHPYIQEAKITRKLRDLIQSLQLTASGLVIVAPKLSLPQELEKDVTVFDYPLPTADDVKGLLQLLERDIQQNPKLRVQLNDEEREVLVQAALGLTENEAKNVFAKALVSGSSLTISDVDIVLEEKKQIVRKSGILEYYDTQESFGTIGGLTELKEWLQIRAGALTKRAREFHLPPPKGLLLIGVPGCGKSLAARAIAAEWRQPLLKLDVGRVFEGLVGSSEANIRRTIQFAEAVAPAILWIDEIEKGFAGTKSLGDSGTSARVFSSFLTWMQEKTSPIFVVATANDISALPPELLRKGRFDETFFVDLPFEHEREEILRIHVKKRGRDAEQLGLDLKSLARDSEGYSGAELEQSVVSALFLAFSTGHELSTEIIRQALHETYPLAQTMKERIRELQAWVVGRARYASDQRRDAEGHVKSLDRWASIGR